MIIFVDYSLSNSVFLNCLGIFLSATLSVALVMVPRFRKRKAPVKKIHQSSQGGDSGSHGAGAASSHHGGAGVDSAKSWSKASKIFGDMPDEDDDVVGALPSLPQQQASSQPK